MQLHLWPATLWTGATGIMLASAEVQHIARLDLHPSACHPNSYYMHWYILKFYPRYTVYTYSTFLHSRCSMLHIHPCSPKSLISQQLAPRALSTNLEAKIYICLIPTWIQADISALCCNLSLNTENTSGRWAHANLQAQSRHSRTCLDNQNAAHTATP